MSDNKASLKASKSQIFFVNRRGCYSVHPIYKQQWRVLQHLGIFFNNKGEEDDVCIAKLIKRADTGDDHALNRLMYPSQAYIKRTCEKGVENLSERERYYFKGFGGDRCETWGFKTPKSKGDEANTTSGEGNLTRAEANNGEARTTGSKADKTKREGNSTEEQNAGR